MERKTLTEWPTELPEGRWEYVFDNSGIYDWTGRFRIGADGDIVFDDADGGVWTCEAFRRGEAFRPVEEDYIAPVRDLAAEAILDADSDPDPRDARIAALEGELSALRAQLAAPPVIDRIAMRDAIADALGSSAYDCTRVWEAWSYGTMGQNDFRPVVDDEDRLMEIVDAVVDAIASRQPCGVGVKV